MEQLTGRVAAITGGGGGIGAALALACADAGMDVALADVEAAKAEAVAEAVRGRGRRALAAGVDVRRQEDLEAFAQRTFDELGGCHLLCNNAGVLVLGLTHTALPRGLGVGALGEPLGRDPRRARLRAAHDRAGPRAATW